MSQVKVLALLVPSTGGGKIWSLPVTQLLVALVILGRHLVPSLSHYSHGLSLFLSIQIFSLYQDVNYTDLRSTNDLTITDNLQRPSSQIRGHLEVLGVRSPKCLFWGT